MKKHRRPTPSGQRCEQNQNRASCCDKHPPHPQFSLPAASPVNARPDFLRLSVQHAAHDRVGPKVRQDAVFVGFWHRTPDERRAVALDERYSHAAQQDRDSDGAGGVETCIACGRSIERNIWMERGYGTCCQLSRTL